MRLLIEAHHPAHIHFFKNAIRQWLADGAEVKLIGRDRDVMRHLLEAYDYIPSEIASSAGGSNHFPLKEMLKRQLVMTRTLASFKPDLVLSLMGSYTQAAKVWRVPSLIFTDSEFQHFNHRIAHPFATHIYTPECFWKDLGPKQRRYRGYHELAFLHPSRFSPRLEVLEMLGAQAGTYLIVRVSAWDTLHDVGESGFGEALDEFMEAATERYQVFIVPEGGKLSQRWQAHRLPVPPDYFHDALANAAFVLTEGASTAAECACLGVPSLYLNSTSRGYLDEMAERYGLVSRHSNARSALKQLKAWLKTPPDPDRARQAAAQLVADNIDVTAFIVNEANRLAQN